MQTRQSLQRSFIHLFKEYTGLTEEWKKAVDDSSVLVNKLANLQFKCLYPNEKLWGDNLDSWILLRNQYLYQIYSLKSSTLDEILRIVDALVKRLIYVSIKLTYY